MRNQWSWRTKSRLKAIDNTVKISQVIGKKDNFWQPFYPSFTNTTVVLVSEDKKTFETTKATADWLWNITFLKRWLADDWTDTEVSAFKRAWMPWTLMYVTFGSEDYENKADVSIVPTKTSDLLNDCWFVDSTALAWYAQNCDLCCVAFTNQYCDLDWQPTASDYDINDLADSYCCKDKRDCKQDALVEWANICITWCTISATVPTQACDIWALPDTTKYWASVDLSIDNSTYVITSQLKDQCWCNLGSACTIDLPLESVVVDWCYNCCTKEIELTLENSCKICFSVADLVSWLQTEITCSNKLSSDLVDDSWHTNLFVDCTEKCCINSALQPNDNVSCLCNDAWYLTTTTLPSLWSRVVKVEVATTNGTAAKVGTTTAGNYSPAAWDILLVHFKYWNSAAGVTLKVDNSAAKAIRIWWKVTTAATFTIPNQTDMYVFLMYDWQAYVAYPTDNTTYSASSFDIKNLSDSCSCRDHWNCALQPNDNVSCLCNDAGYVTSSAIPDVSWFVDESCIACINGCCLTNWWDITIQGAGGDMEKCVYDPNSCNADAFDYCNMFNTPTIPTDNCQLANGCWYTTCTWTVTATDLACYAQCCDVPTNNNQLINGCWFTTCTWTVTSSDLACYAQCCDMPNLSCYAQCCDLACKQDTLTAWNNISINSNTISGNFNYATSSTAAACTTKCVCIPEITQLCVGQQITVKPSVTATNCATSLQLNSFTAYPIRYNNAALTSTTDWYIRWADCLSTFIFDWSYWHVASKSYDTNTTYALNYTYDAWKHIAGVGKYAISRYSLVMEKADWTWETLKETSTNYSTATTKTVNTNGFRLNSIRYYNTTTVYANGALIAANTLNSKAASVDMRYSTNCGGTTDWAEWDYIYLVWTIWADWLFYLDTTTRWTKTLPTTKDGKVYIRLWIALAAAWYTISLLEDRPIYYYDNWLKIYQQADNKQDVLVSWTTIKTINWCDLLGSWNICISWGGGWWWDMLASTYDPCGCNADAFDYTNLHDTPTIPTDNCQLANSCGFTTCTGTLQSCDIANLAQCCDIPTNNNQLSNGCGYTTCTWTLVASDLTWYAKSCDLKAVATSWKYCDLTWTPTIPTNNNQLTNGCWYTTCTWTLSSCADIITALWYTPYSSANPNWYTTCTGTLTSGDLACYACCCDIPTDNCQLWNSCWYITSSYHDSSKQDTLCAWNWIDITSNTVSTASVFWTSTTSAWTATKEVTISSITSLDVWQLIVVKPTITSTTTTTMKLKLNSFAAYNILYDGSSVTTSSVAGTVWRAYVPSIFVLDDSSWTKYWRFAWHGIDNNTAYSSMTTTEIDGWTCTCCRVITAANLKYAINHYADLSCYAQCCDIPTVPTDNCQLANWCGFTTCTWTLTSSDISWLVAESCIACINGCCLTNGGDICVWGGWGGTVMCECCYDPWDYQQDFLYFTY